MLRPLLSSPSSLPPLAEHVDRLLALGLANTGKMLVRLDPDL